MLATLNARAAMRGQLSDTQTVSMGKLKGGQTGSQVYVSTFPPNTLLVCWCKYKRSQQRTLDIKVDTQRQYHSDVSSALELDAEV